MSLTDHQRRIVDRIRSGTPIRVLAKELGVNRRNIQRTIERAAVHGYTTTGTTMAENPPGFVTGKSTVQIASDGTIEREWRRVYPGTEGIEEWVDNLCERAGKAGPTISQPKVKAGKRLLEIPIGDLHAGMYAWSKETGTDYDADTASRLFRVGSQYLFDRHHGANELVLADLGDFLHADNRHGVTERGGNILDTDTRWQRVIDIARDSWVSVIESAANRFASVTVYMIPGNHNFHSAYWLARIIQAWFRNTKHVTVCTDPKTYRFHRWQSVLLGYSHGHLIKASNLASVMATSARGDWADTRHHHWRCGHIHHSVRELYRDHDESDGVTVEYFPTLAGRDAYHAEHGYLSRRMMQGIVYDADDGEVERYTVHARMLG